MCICPYRHSQKINMELHPFSWGPLTWTYGTVSSGLCSPGNHATNFFNTTAPKLTWNPPQAQTELSLHPETANMEFEQVITKWSATLKGALKFNLEPEWFLRRSHWKCHVSDFRATLLFTLYCAHGIMLWTWVEPSQNQLNMAPNKVWKLNWEFSMSPVTEWLMTPGTGWPSRNCWLSTKLFTYQVQGVPI